MVSRNERTRNPNVEQNSASSPGQEALAEGKKEDHGPRDHRDIAEDRADARATSENTGWGRVAFEPRTAKQNAHTVARTVAITDTTTVCSSFHAISGSLCMAMASGTRFEDQPPQSLRNREHRLAEPELGDEGRSRAQAAAMKEKTSVS